MNKLLEDFKLKWIDTFIGMILKDDCRKELDNAIESIVEEERTKIINKIYETCEDTTGDDVLEAIRESSDE